MPCDVVFLIPNSSKKIYQDLSSKFSGIEPPTWALLLAQSMRNFGYESRIIDCDAERLTEEQSAERVVDINARLVCFVLYGQQPNQGTFLMIGATSLADKIKKLDPLQKISFVGSHVSALPKEVLSDKNIDFVLYNEGVYALRDLLKTNLKDYLNKVSGIGYKEENNLIINNSNQLVPQEKMHTDMPGYAWDLLPKNKNILDKYRAHYWHNFFSDEGRSPFAAVYSSLGCRFGCNFCMINIVNRTDTNDEVSAADSRLMRHWDVDFFLDQLEFLNQNNVYTVRLSDEMFFLNKKFYQPILEGIIERGLKFNLWAYARIDTIREDQLELFKKAGVNWLCLGIEAGNQNVRLDIEKGRFRELNIREVVKLIKSFDINILGNYIFGLPEDNIETMEETLQLAMGLNTEHANFYPCQALPGSPLYFEAKLHGWDTPNTFEEYAFYSYECKPLPTKHITGKDVLKFRDEAFQRYFRNSTYLDLVEKKFGIKQRKNVLEMANVKLERKILQ
jgi:radical SAM superfamily enzyme YgiQ (UPF0313 family)